MKAYLYLLPFKDNKHFKIGISTGTFARVLKHDSTYGIDLESSLIVSCKKSSTISALETLLLNMFPISETIEYKDKDGYTEIRAMNHWQKALSEIDYLSDSLGLKMSTFNHVFQEDFIKKKISIRRETTPEQEKENRGGQFFNFIAENKNSISKVFYNKFENLVIEVKVNPGDLPDDGLLNFNWSVQIEDGWCNLLGSIGYSYDDTDQKNVVRFHVRDNQFYPETKDELEKLYSLIDYHSLNLDRLEGVKAEKLRIETIEADFLKRFESKEAIKFKNIETGKLIFEPFDSIFSNLTAIRYFGLGYQMLYYKGNKKRCFCCSSFLKSAKDFGDESWFLSWAYNTLWFKKPGDGKMYQILDFDYLCYVIRKLQVQELYS